MAKLVLYVVSLNENFANADWVVRWVVKVVVFRLSVVLDFPVLFVVVGVVSYQITVVWNFRMTHISHCDAVWRENTNTLIPILFRCGIDELI